MAAARTPPHGIRREAEVIFSIYLAKLSVKYFHSLSIYPFFIQKISPAYAFNDPKKRVRRRDKIAAAHIPVFFLSFQDFAKIPVPSAAARLCGADGKKFGVFH